jgi:hypothetical protein
MWTRLAPGNSTADEKVNFVGWGTGSYLLK